MFINRIINNVATSLMQKAVLLEFKFKNKYQWHFKETSLKKCKLFKFYEIMRFAVLQRSTNVRNKPAIAI